jgi:hypothetical protein
MTHKWVANSVSKEGVILFTPIPYNVEVCYAAGPLKVRVSLWSQNGSPPPPKPLQQLWCIYQHIATAHLCQLTNTVPVIERFCLLLAQESTMGWILTLAYETSTNYWPERFSVAYCMCIVQTKLMHKNWRHPQKLIFTSTEGPTDVPLGAVWRGCWAVTYNTQLSIYQ